MQAPDLVPIVPELLLIAAALAVLVVEPFLKSDRSAAVAIALGGAVASGVAALMLAGENRTSFNEMLVLNDYAVFFKVLFAAAASLTILMSPHYLTAHRRHLGEYYALVLFAVVGMDIMAASRDLIAFYMGLELMAMSSYLLAALFRYQVRSNEAALKYFITGTFASAIGLFGISLVYGLAGTTNYLGVAQALYADPNSVGVVFAAGLVAVGLGFKISAAPFHMWTPDVYEGSPTPVAGFFSVGPKSAGFAVIAAVFLSVFGAATSAWSMLFIILSILTMLVGNVMALAQKNVKRLLAYSSIAHAGYLLAGISALGWGQDDVPGKAVLVYLAAYTFMNMGAFGVLAYLKSQRADGFDYSLKQFAGLGRRSPWAAILLSLFLLSLTGIPGTAGFIGKFYVFGAVVRADLVWLAVIGVLLSAVSAFYYLRVVMYMFFREPEEDYEVREPLRGTMALSLGLSALGVLVIGFLPAWLWGAAAAAFASIFG